jgi:hypothetical protein
MSPSPDGSCDGGYHLGLRLPTHFLATISPDRLAGVIVRAVRRVRLCLVMGKLLPGYLLLGLLKHLVPISWLARWAWRRPAGRRDYEQERRLKLGVLRLSQMIGLPDRDCLQRSLLLYRALSRAGAEPILVLGLKRVNDRTLGHAWVLVDDRPLLDSDADLRSFAPALSFGRCGKLLPTVSV